MSDKRRLTTDRFYGGTEHRLDLLIQFLSYVRSEHPSESAASEWLVQYTNANSQSAAERHIGFLSYIGVVAISNGQLSVGDFGAEWFERREPRVLFEALQNNVQGFDVILRSLMEDSQTDTDLMQALNTSGEFDMDSPGVAIRHREWLQVLGYVSHNGDENMLTTDGRALATNLGFQQMRKSNNAMGIEALPELPSFEPGERYDRRAIHEAYGGTRYRGIATPADTPVVLLFTGDSGSEYGYEDGFEEDGTFVYTGEGQEGDMEMERGNAAIRDHVQNGKKTSLVPRN